MVSLSDDNTLNLLTAFQSLAFEQVLAYRLKPAGCHVVLVDLVQLQDCPCHWVT